MTPNSSRDRLEGHGGGGGVVWPLQEVLVGGCLPPWTPPPPGHTTTTLPGHHQPPGHHIPVDTPHPSGSKVYYLPPGYIRELRSMDRRCASYWNAFLFFFLIFTIYISIMHFIYLLRLEEKSCTKPNSQEDE